jgi:hypothetical protein
MPMIEWADELIDWYWRFGLQRKDRFALPLEIWGDRLYQARAGLAEASQSLTNPKPCMALWGPSQSGKSTLLSTYVDAGADALGCGSSLDWPGGVPARFVARSEGTAGTVLNPVRIGVDASGCVSRFTLRDTIADPKHPVEIRLAAPAQIMHALALGYLSECRVQDSGGQKVTFIPETFRQRLEQPGKGASPATPERTAFEAWHQFADLIETLAYSELTRFENLKSSWTALRRQLLESAPLAASHQNLEAFAADILWDGQPTLTGLYRQFAQLYESLKRSWAGKPILCSLKVASALLDIQGCKQIHDAGSASATADNRKFSDLAHSISFEVGPDAIRLGENYANPLVRNLEDFGLLQGLVWELIIPLRKQALDQNAPQFCRFLEAADLLDFPGVKQGDRVAHDELLDLSKLDQADRFKLFAEVFKRGKTASIVMSYAKGVAIDGFSLLTRMAQFPSKPDQLTIGIQAWWRSFAPEFNPHSTQQRSPLPLNLVLTFCGITVNQALKAGVPATLPPVFQRLAELGVLSHPSVVTTFATTYPGFPGGELIYEGKVVDSSHLVVQNVSGKIEQDPSFHRQFGLPVSLASFHAMLKDGGTDYLFDQLREQAALSQRMPLLQRRLAALQQTLRELHGEASPNDDGYLAQRKKDITEWKQAIAQRLIKLGDEGQVAVSSLRLRQLLEVDAETLEPIPLALPIRGGQKPSDDYLQKQLRAWKASKAEPTFSQDEATLCGLRDTAHLSRSLHYLIETIPVAELSHWLLKHFNGLKNMDDARENRRYLAVKMTNLLLGADKGRLHPDPTQVLANLNSFSDADNSPHFRYEDSPHYSSFIKPFLGRLDEVLAQTPPWIHPDQPGDKELPPIP